MFGFARRVAAFKDRADAGKQLSEAVADLKSSNPVVLALPRGGVPIAYEVAKVLEAPLDLLFVRKIGCPGHEEYGIGAVVDSGKGHEPTLLMNEEAVQMVRPPKEYVQVEMQRQIKEIDRQRTTYLRGREHIPLTGRTVIVCDDGIATGGTAKVALQALKKLNVARAVLAVPVGPQDSVGMWVWVGWMCVEGLGADSVCIPDEIRAEGNEVRCLRFPPNFQAVGLHYESFPQTTDQEVIRCLDESERWQLRN